GEQVQQFENRNLRADGSVCWLQWSARGVPEEGLIYAAARDVTESRRAAEEQAALRRLATLVAQGVGPEVLFDTVAAEAANAVPGIDTAAVGRFVDDRSIAFVGGWSIFREPEWVGQTVDLGGRNVSSIVFETGRPARVDQLEVTVDGVNSMARDSGARASAGAPITVEGRLWGVLVVASGSEDRLPPGIEHELAGFTELVATAIANTEAREQLGQLAQEQAALRRVATLVAEGVSPGSVFDAVAGEMETMLDADQVTLNRFEPGDEILALAYRGADLPHVPAGSRVRVEGDSATARVRRSGQPARMENYEGAEGPIAERFRATALRSSVAVPIALEGSQLWGVITASWKRTQSPPADTEERMFRFAQLLATAIANADSREALRQLADEQAALRRVATLVAEGASPDAVFDAVAAEMEKMLNADQVALNRFEPGEQILALAHRGVDPPRVPPGARVRVAGDSATARVRRTEKPARMENYEGAEGAIAENARAKGLRSSVAVPIALEGSQLWGVITASWKRVQSPPADTEQRMFRFAQLLATAIANTESRSQLVAARRRVIEAADAARATLARDLHDGAQQQFVIALIDLQLAQQKRDADADRARELVDLGAAQVQRGVNTLRELAAGVHPAILSRLGLQAALESLAARMPLPLSVDVDDLQLPKGLEASVYFFCSEALTNVVKHAEASTAWVGVHTVDGRLRVEVRDDGIGGAEIGLGGSGLTG
ncbi:MAG: GAF domain-containing protein, partial [Solirubrobacterales bacterium]|nr:GAF domain-containing protein [Solirubrobacterales bacterium]